MSDVIFKLQTPQIGKLDPITIYDESEVVGYTRLLLMALQASDHEFTTPTILDRYPILDTMEKFFELRTFVKSQPYRIHLIGAQEK